MATSFSGGRIKPEYPERTTDQALMSSLTSILNSASSIMTMDLWRQFRKTATQSELMIVGRVTVLVLVIVSILWLPISSTLFCNLQNL
jgi:Na+/proline symporter